MKSKVLAFLISAIFSMAVSDMGWADKFPEKPISVIVPWAPGGGTDVLARAVCPIWQKELGVPMIIVNKPGGNNIVGYNATQKAPPDGYTLVLGQSPNLNVNVLFQDAPYKLDDFEFINLFQIDYTMFYANKDAPWNSLSDLIIDAKKKPGQIRLGCAATLGVDLIFVKEFEERAGIKLGEVIPLGGGADLRREVIGGHLMLAVHSNWVARPAKGLVKGIGVRMLERSAIWPEAQTFNEALPVDKQYTRDEILRLPNLIKGFAVPAGTKAKHPERFQKLVQTFEKTMKRPEFEEMIKKQEMATAIHYFGPEESKEVVKNFNKTLLQYKSLFEGGRK